MKKIFCLLFVSIGLISFGQQKILNNRFLPVLFSSTINPVSHQMNYNNSLSGSGNISLYNATTNLNDNYFILGKSYVMSNTKSFPNSGFGFQSMTISSKAGKQEFRSALVYNAVTSILQIL
jgi:hypothetical protein